MSQSRGIFHYCDVAAVPTFSWGSLFFLAEVGRRLVLPIKSVMMITLVAEMGGGKHKIPEATTDRYGSIASM